MTQWKFLFTAVLTANVAMLLPSMKATTVEVLLNPAEYSGTISIRLHRMLHGQSARCQARL